MDAPDGLSERGTALWQAMTRARPFSPSAAILLGEACRLTDRLDRLDRLLTGDLDAWASIRPGRDDDEPMVLVLNNALSEARQQASTLRQIVATIEEMTPKESDEPSDALARLLGGMPSAVRDSSEPGSDDPRVAGR